MKSLILTLLLVAPATLGFAQIRTPAASPSAKVMQDLGLSSITVEYSRPSVKGRKIFAEDGLVPFGKIWRTGANQATKVDFGEDVVINGKKIEAGEYAILTKPMQGFWTFMLYPYESGSWNSYVEKTPAVTFDGKATRNANKTESFLIYFDKLTAESANMNFAWAETLVSVPVTTEVNDMVEKAIKRTLAGPSAGDFYTAGNYYFTSGGDMQKAYEYVKKANEMEKDKFWRIRTESLILAEMGKYGDAIDKAEKSLELATKAGNEDYVRMNQASIKEWKMKK